MRVALVGLTVLLAIGLVAGLADAQSKVPQPASFRVEWERRPAPFWRPAIEGYVYNDSEYRVGNVRLRIDVLDASGRRVDAKSAWVPGAIDARARGYFVVAPPPEGGQAYEITVESFDLLARQPAPLPDLQAP